jgi:hypothetical protein
MDIDEIDNEALRCLHLAARATDLVAADQLRSRAVRLNGIAEALEQHGVAILGPLPSTPMRVVKRAA